MQANTMQATETRHPSAAGGHVATPQELVAYLEGISGKVFYTRDDVSVWLAEVRDQAAREARATVSRKRMVLFAFLLAAFLQYEFINIMLEVNSLNASTLVVPVRASYRS